MEGQRSPTPEVDVITDGQYVLVQRGEQDKIIEFRAEGKLKFGKLAGQQEIELKNALGHPFFTTFRVQPYPSSEDRKKRCYFLEAFSDRIQDPLFAAERTAGSGKDNRNLVDDNRSQVLGQTDIAVLREKGVSGPEILDTLINSSKTFTLKTEFSQEKYLKKKVRAYGDSLLFVKPTLKLVADYYFKVDPVKIMNLRPDSLAQMLSYANISSGGRYMVYETGCSSLVIAGVLQRLGGKGLCLHVHTGSTPQRQALYYMNFTPYQLTPLQTLDVFYIIRHSRSRPADSDKTVEEDGVPLKKRKMVQTDDTVTVVEPETEPGCEDSKPPSSTNPLKSVTRLENEASAVTFNTTQFEGLIICAKEHPLSIVQHLLPRLKSSSPFVIFCQYMEPLGDCFSWLKDGNYGINLNIVDNWYRCLQIESERTHPEINMSSNGGYILTGTYIKQRTT